MANAVKFLGWHKKFGPAQNILGPVKGQRYFRSASKISLNGQGIRILDLSI